MNIEFYCILPIDLLKYNVSTWKLENPSGCWDYQKIISKSYSIILIIQFIITPTSPYSCAATAAEAMGGPQLAKSQHGDIYLCCAHFLSAAYCLPSCLPDGSHRFQKLASASKLNLFHARPASWQPFSLQVLFNHKSLTGCLFTGLTLEFPMYLPLFTIKAK